MNEEDLLIVKLKYGADFSYKTDGEYFDVLDMLPERFIAKHRYYHFLTVDICHTINFKKKLLSNLIAYIRASEQETSG